LTYFGQSDASL